jgi:hypothetical protein
MIMLFLNMEMEVWRGQQEGLTIIINPGVIGPVIAHTDWEKVWPTFTKVKTAYNFIR